ncbi:MAG: anthranilate phosphoribosyltransferase [Candidatus Firestonebacteria bacterium]
MIKESLLKIIEQKKNLTSAEVSAAMDEIMSGLTPPSLIAAFLVALRAKGETVEEITGAAESMRKNAVYIKSNHKLVVDTCGTGGDKSDTFNVSTTAAFIVAGAGVPVAKHGNRAVSSKCGSADLVEALGVKIEIPPEKISECLDETGMAYLFAPLLHVSMKYVAPIRKDLGIRTIFNMIGPLANPARVKAQVLGVFSERLMEDYICVLKRLGHTHAFVVHGADNLDEISITGETKIIELKDGKIIKYSVKPEDFGMKRAKLSDIKGGDIKQNAVITMQILEGELGVYSDTAVLNAAAGIVAGGKARSLKDGIILARKSVESGAALKALHKLVKCSNS